MSELGKRILQTGKVVAADGSEHPLHSETRLEQCEFLAGLVKQTDAKVCLEVGLAYGLSSLFICEAMRGKPGARLISVDPSQNGETWKGIGLHNLRSAGFGDMIEFHETGSQMLLPQLLAEGKTQLDFAYVDTTKIFDYLLVDAFFISRLLRVGGIMVFDDCGSWRGPQKLARFLSTWPHFKVVAGHAPYQVNSTRRAASALARLLPGREKLFTHDLVRPARELGINYNCIALQKTGEDARDWRWFEPF